MLDIFFRLSRLLERAEKALGWDGIRPFHSRYFGLRFSVRGTQCELMEDFYIPRRECPIRRGSAGTLFNTLINCTHNNNRVS